MNMKNDDARLHRIPSKLEGMVATPPHVAEYLVVWAVRQASDLLLDIGAGEGIFLLEAYRRFMALGVSPEDIPQRLVGVEQNTDLYRRAVEALHLRFGRVPSCFFNADLFDVELPMVDALVGNPPYVRRMHLERIDEIRSKLISKNLFLPALNGLTDLYIYFLMYATQYLRKGGRMATITSSAWLDVDYGVALKQLLLRDYRIRGIVMFEGRLFEHALIKSAFIFAEKDSADPHNMVRFIRVRDGLTGIPPAEQLLKLPSGMRHYGLAVSTVEQGELNPYKPWGLYLKAPETYSSLVKRDIFAPLKQLALSRIGLQTLAGKFYILSHQALLQSGIPLSCVRPLAFSPRDFTAPIIRTVRDATHYVLYVRDENEIRGNEALRRYIEHAENRPVKVRAKGVTVAGYQNLPRLQKARRVPWYSLTKEIDRRGQYTILLPRRFYEEFMVLWNQAKVIANENFIEIEPHEISWLKPMLAFFNSSCFELIARSHAQLYGGGVYNLNPGDVPCLPVLDVRQLGGKAMKELAEAYDKFLLARKEERRSIVDMALARCLGWTGPNLEDLQNATLELRDISRRAKCYLSASHLTWG